MRNFVFLLFLILSFSLFANPIMNVRAIQEGKTTVLLYDMTKNAYVSDVEIVVDGASRVIPANTLSGDIGREIMVGKDRRIEYDVLMDYVDGLRSDNISFVIISGAQAVDLGLSVKWASCNVGTNLPEEYGDYFAWGETEPKIDYSWNTYKHGTASNQLTKYCTKSTSGKYGFTDNKTMLDPKDDAATANWGEAWRIPTTKEQYELRTKCKWVWTTLNGVNGYKVTGPNGNSIFLPATGYILNSSLYNAGSYGYYWSSSLGTESPGIAYLMRFDSDYVDWYNDGRSYGRSVRPVCP